MESTIILLSGHAFSGKTTTANILKSLLEENDEKVCIIPFAAYLKFSAREYFNWNGKKDDLGRTILQDLGSDVRKIDINFWVDIVINSIKVFEIFDYFIIDDCRYLNEIERFTDFGFDPLRVRIERLNFDNHLSIKQKNHASETALDNYRHWDWTISAESGIDNLRKEVELFYKSNWKTNE
jgi:hypothetical protein